VRIKGKVELFTPTAVVGWLAAFGAPEDRIRLELLLDGISIAIATADGARPDVAAHGFGDGACQFEFTLSEPLTRAEAERLQLRIVGSDLILEVPRDLSLFADPAPPAPTAEAVKPEPLKVFIVGSPRSGTSVLLRAMQTVVGLSARGESHVIPAVARAVFQLNAYYDRFAGASADLLIHQLPLARIEAPMFDAIRAFYREIYEGQDFADKTPSDEAVHGAALIRRIFPDARLIVTRRNGIEVVDSYRRKFGKPFIEACGNWANMMRGLVLLKRDCPDIFEIDQFDIANAPAVVAERIAVYLARPAIAPPLADFFATNREDRLSTHDWARRLTLADVPWTDEERDIFTRLCGEQMRRYGYDVA
jgi:hypothetical protein